MRAAKSPRQYHFALPRLMASFRGRDTHPTETNWAEANVVGAAVMLVSYLAIARPFLSGATALRTILCLLPILFATWIFWLLVLYLDAQIIKLLRAVGLLAPSVSNARAQSFLIVMMISALASKLLHGPPSLRAVGALWITGVALNVFAAALLKLRHGR